MARVIVIGAGISGLAAARALSVSGHEAIVFEQDIAPGGRVRSERVGGFLMERGAGALALPAPEAQRLVSALGLGERMVRQNAAARRRYLVRGGRAHELPGDPGRWLASGLFSLAGRMRLLVEPFIAAREGDETVAEFALRRLGREMLDYVVEPVIAGLRAGDPRRLSVSAAMPALKRFETEHGSVLMGALRARREASAHGCALVARGLFSFADGLGTLPRAIASAMPGRVHLGHRVETVRRSAGGRFRVRVRCGNGASWVAADVVIVALPAYAAAVVLSDLDRDAAHVLAGIAHPPLAVVHLGYGSGAIGHPLDGSGMLMPAVEKRGVLGILFSSSLFQGRAPPGHVALTAYVGGAREPHLAHLPPRELVALAHAQVRELLDARKAPVFGSSRCWPRALPQPGMDHGERLARIAAFEAEHAGLFLAGNYLAGVSTAKCIEQAARTAERARLALAAFRGATRQAA